MKYSIPDEERFILLLPRSMGKSTTGGFNNGKIHYPNPRAITSVLYPKLFNVGGGF